jgi:hypothetical protein
MRNEVTSTWTIQYRNVVTIHNIIRPKGHSFHQKIWRCRKKSQLKANIFAENGLFNEYFLVKTTTKSQPTQPNPNSHIYCQQWCLSCLIQPTKRPLSLEKVFLREGIFLQQNNPLYLFMDSRLDLLSLMVFHIYISSTKQQQLYLLKCGENRNHGKFKIYFLMIEL